MPILWSVGPEHDRDDMAAALSAAMRFWSDFDRRVTNQHLLDAHAADAAKADDAAQPVTPSEVSGERTAR